MKNSAAVPSGIAFSLLLRSGNTLSAMIPASRYSTNGSSHQLRCLYAAHSG